MGSKSHIEWTEATWNPTRGCSHVSPGCANCYAERFAHRLGGAGKAYDRLTRITKCGPRWTGRVELVGEALQLPLRWRNPRLVFVDSMSDLFHEKVPLGFIRDVFDIMRRADSHTFQVLTKRAERLHELAPKLAWPANVWMGVSIETSAYVHRASLLSEIPASVRFLSIEPLLERIPRLPLDDIHWVIVGGESGPRARPVDRSWVREIRDACTNKGIPFFFKQWGGTRKWENGRRLDGRLWSEMPSSDPPAGRTGDPHLFDHGSEKAGIVATCCRGDKDVL